MDIEDAYTEAMISCREERETVENDVRAAMLAVLEKAEAIYASNYARASEDDDVAKGFRAFRADINNLGKWR